MLNNAADVRAISRKAHTKLMTVLQLGWGICFALQVRFCLQFQFERNLHSDWWG